MGYYLDESINDNKFNENLVNDIEYLGDFNKGYDYSSIIQVKNKICKIKKFLIQKHYFVALETDYDFDVENFSVKIYEQVLGIFFI